MKLMNDELDAILAKGGLRINQPYNSRGSYRKDEYIFTTCMECGVEAHYRLKYILDKNAQGSAFAGRATGLHGTEWHTSSTTVRCRP